MVKQPLLADDWGISIDEKVAVAGQRLREFRGLALGMDAEDGYYGCFSGGKDSVCIKRLAEMAGVEIKWHYSVTTIDPPELVRFIKREHAEVEMHHPPKCFFTVMADERGYPLRHQRWCCQELKEGGGAGKVKVLGIRWAESDRRRKTWKLLTRWSNEQNHGKRKEPSWALSPIIDWTAENVWAFIRTEHIPYCSLYDEGFKRLGCIGCPMGGAKGVARDFARWPKYEQAWRRAFHRLWGRRRGDLMKRGAYKGRSWPGMPRITTADELFAWWQSGNALPEDDDGCMMGLY